MNHAELNDRRAELKAAMPGLLDLAETNLYRRLPRLYPELFAEVRASNDAKAPYRCHLAELMMEHLGLEPGLRSRVLVSHGVRRSLSSLFTILAARGVESLVPGDVYPVYGELARRAGASFTEYAARDGLPPREALDSFGALLVCDPLKPWGGSLTPAECDRISAWSRGGDRIAIVDAAYSFRPSPHIEAMAREGACCLLGSLSKGWLIPDHLGYCFLPEQWTREARSAFAALPKDESKLRVGFAALSEDPNRPSRVAGVLARLAERMEGELHHRRIPAAAVSGYFTRTPLDFQSLLDAGCVGIPASVFGAPDDAGCLVSTLGLE
ncbi:MAG: aminotransferase class I/II-fold pyridoxal phosphate-dependent enzyme [Phycisphaerales bacterium]